VTEAASTPADDQLRLKVILDHIAEDIVTLDTRGVVVSFSRSAEAIFGYRREETVGRGIDVLVVRGAGRDGDALEIISRQLPTSRATAAKCWAGAKVARSSRLSWPRVKHR
jgi:PAS domain S-box-containing protein